MNKSNETKWFTEAVLPFAEETIKTSFAINDILYDEQSAYGHIQIIDTPRFGKILYIDGILQIAEKDEFIYHEMLVQTPALYHGKPESLLIIGGGDGGALRQALRIKSLKKIVQVEIDTKVIEISKKYLPSISQGAFDDPRAEIVLMDGAEYIQQHQNEFDVIIVDITDPVEGSPAEKLYQESFYAQVKKSLKANGIVAMQSGSPFMQPDEVRMLTSVLSKCYTSVLMETAVYPSQLMVFFGFMLASDQPLGTLSVEELRERFENISGENDYITPEIVQAAPLIPPYLKKQLA